MTTSNSISVKPCLLIRIDLLGVSDSV